MEQSVRRFEMGVKSGYGLKLFGYVAWIFLSGVNAGSEPSTSDAPWTLERCLEYAMSHNPLLQSDLLRKQVTQGQNESLVSDFIPRVEVNYKAARNNQTTGTLKEGASKEDTAPSVYSKEIYTSGLSISDTLYSKRMAPAFRLVDVNQKVAASQIRQTQNDLVMNVKKAFYTVLFTEQNLTIALAAESVAKENFDTSELLFKEGKLSSFDVSRSKVRWISARADTLSAKNSNIVARESLKTVLSLPQEEPLEVSGTFPDFVQDKPLEKGIEEALMFRPEMEQMDLGLRVLKEAEEVAKAGYYPSLNASFNYSLAAAEWDTGLDEQYDTWSALLSVSIPIFDGMNTLGKTRVARAQYEQAKYNRESLGDSIIMEVRQAYFTLKNAEESLGAQKESVSTTRENLDIARERYAMGLLSQLELKDVELSLISAETQYVKTLFDYNMAVVLLERACGLPYRA